MSFLTQQLLREGGPAPGQRSIVYGEVSRNQPAPTHYDDPLYVVIPDYDPTVPYQCVTWPAMHGRAMPQPGAPVLLIFDSHHQPWCVSWVGSWVEWDIGAD